MNTFPVASYYSTTDGECVVPESWGGVWENINGGSDWQQTSGAFPVRQAYGGAGGVVATDAVENGGNGNSVYFYNGTNWSFFGNGGSQFAAGGGLIAGISLDPKFGIFPFNTATGWGPGIGVPPIVPPPPSAAAAVAPGTPVVTGVTVTQNGVIVATDYLAQPWYYDPSNPGWTQIAGPGDQFIAGGTRTRAGVWALNPSHNALFFWPGPGQGFDPGFGVSPTTQIVANSDSDFLAISVAGQAAFTFGSTTITNTLQGGVFGPGSLMPLPLFEFLGAPGSGLVDDGVYLCQSGDCTSGPPNPIYSNGIGGWLISGALPFVTGCDSGSAPCVTLTANELLTQPNIR
ncbi:MAG: hypothetical protein FWD17_09560 [Polyangiaceae bacterium]|nr:hypothetical protein [Polyangiaceae bacterium]